MTTDNLFGLPHILFELHSDPTFEDAKHILRHANKWLADNATSQYHPVVLRARNRLGERVTNAFLLSIINRQPPVPVCGDEPEEGWSPE